MIRLICGDSYQEIKKIPEKSIDLVYIDVPYSFETSGGGGAFGTKKRPYHNDILLGSNETKNGFDLSILEELCRVMKHIYIYIWCSKEQLFPIMKYFIEQKQCRMNLLVWCKTNPTPATNNLWLPDIEYCLVFKDKDAPKYNNGYELKSRWHVSATNKADKELWEHPTIKPLELVERHLKHSTNPGDTVLDCFMGSGTTGVACRNLDRNFIGIEIEQKYFDIAKRRIETQIQQTQLF